jgi:hypothetical protein
LNAPPMAQPEPVVEQIAATANERPRIDPMALALDGPIAPAASVRNTPIVPGSPARAGMPTTFGASSGVLESPAPTAARWKLALVGLAAMLVSFGIVAVVSGRGSTIAQPTPAEQSTPTSQSTTRAQPMPTSQSVPTALPTTSAQPTTAAPAAAITPPAVTSPPAATEQPTTAAQPNATASTTAHAPDGGIRAAGTKTQTSPTKPKSVEAPARLNAHVPDAGTKAPSQRSNGHKFDPDAVGGQEED